MAARRPPDRGRPAACLRGMSLPLLCLLLSALVATSCRKPPPKPPPPPPPKASASVEPPLGEVTLQSALEAAWDGDVELCYRRAKTAMSIAPDDLETMELMLRCAQAQKILWAAEAWVKSAYAVRLGAPVVRYALGLVQVLRGNHAEGRKLLERLVDEAPVAAYQAALSAQIDDDAVAAERLVALYVKARPTDPAGRRLQASIVCSVDLVRCAAIMETLRSTDDDETAVARRLGAAFGTGAAISRETLVRLSREAGALGSTAFADALEVAAILREGADPAGVLVRSPRSGRPEPGKTVDLAREARPIPRLPFVTRVLQLSAASDPQTAATFSRLQALFPTDLGTYQLARRAEKTALLARKELEAQTPLRWRAVAALELARADELCELVAGFWWNDRGPHATSARARCDIQTDVSRGRKIADARLAVTPYGVIDVQTAIEGQVAQKDAAGLEALARAIAKVAPSSMLVANALWAAGDQAGKKSHGLHAEAILQSQRDPVLVRRLLRRYVELHDEARAKAVVIPGLSESPRDAYLTGVYGEILLHEGKADEALVYLTRSCQSARARRESEVLGPTLSTLHHALQKAKDKPARETALRCVKGD